MRSPFPGWIAVLLLPLLLGACAESVHISTIRPGVVAANCADKVQCELYWQRTQDWVARNSKRPVANVTEWMLETLPPGNFDSSLTFHIIRWPGPKDSGEIRFEAYCSTFMPCGPTEAQALQDFRRFVTAS